MGYYDKSMKYVSQTQTLIGQQRKRLQDLDTGEVIEVDQITKRALGQRQFWKIYLVDFLQILGVMDSKKIDVLIYILENTQSQTNTYIGTLRGTAKGVGVSLETVRVTIDKLIDSGFLKRIQNGVYQVNPQIMMKGSEHKKQMLLSYYDDAMANNSTDINTDTSVYTDVCEANEGEKQELDGQTTMFGVGVEMSAKAHTD